MLACVACAKHDPDGGGRPTGKEAVKSLSSQIKDMVLKISGATRQGKGNGSSSSSSTSFRSKSFRGDPRRRQRQHGAYTYEDAAHYAATGCRSTTAAWDLTKEEEKPRRGGGKWSGAAEDGEELEDDVGESKDEWVAQVEPGVHITFASLPGGAGNDLKRIRFSREMFNKWQAQRWWGENYDRIMELYNVQRYNRQPLQTPARSDDVEGESLWSGVGSTKESPIALPATTEWQLVGETNKPPSAGAGEGASGVKAEVEASTPSRDEASISVGNARDHEITEWVEHDEPGVHITIRELADGARELRRVRFSREKFGEVHAKLWWEANRERIQAQYL